MSTSMKWSGINICNTEIRYARLSKSQIHLFSSRTGGTTSINISACLYILDFIAITFRGEPPILGYIRVILSVPSETVITRTQHNLTNALLRHEIFVSAHNSIKFAGNWEIHFFVVVFKSYSISFFSRGSSLKLILPRINDFLLIIAKSCLVNIFSYSFRVIVNLSLFLGKSQRSFCRRSNIEFYAISKFIGYSTIRTFNHKHHIARFLHCGKRSILPNFCFVAIILIRERTFSNRSMTIRIGIIPFFSRASF